MNFFSLPHLFKLVKNFFRFFRSFPSCGVTLQAFALHHATLLLYLRKRYLSRTIFIIPAIFACIWHYFTALADSSHIIPSSAPFVKHFSPRNGIYFCILFPYTFVLQQQTFPKAAPHNGAKIRRSPLSPLCGAALKPTGQMVADLR